MITVDQLGAVCSAAEAAVWLDALNAAMDRFEINTVARQSAFLAQCAHESGGFTAVVENLNYGQKGLMATWPKRFDADTAAAYARQPEKIANRVYANRMGNGDEASGDGWRYRGRGLIQCTGRDVYTRCGAALGLPLVDQPELLEQPGPAALSAAWYWSVNGLNALADAGNFELITRRINGGLLGEDDRVARYDAESSALLENDA